MLEQKLLSIFQMALKNIETYKVTFQGLKRFMNILQLFPEDDLLEDILNKISATAQAIKKLKNPFYNILRCQYAIPKLAFEKELFSLHASSKASKRDSEYLPVRFT